LTCPPDNIKTYKVIIKPGSGQLTGNADFTFIRYSKQSECYCTCNSSNYGSLKLAQQEFFNLYGFERAADADLLIVAWFEPYNYKALMPLSY